MFRSLFAAIIGTFIAFIWTSASWTFLPWHHWDMKSFKHGGHAISQAIQTETLDVGIYAIPDLSKDSNANMENQKKWREQTMHGPFVFLAVQPAGMPWDMKAAMGLQLGVTFIVTLILVSLLGALGIAGAFKTALFCSFAVLSGDLLANAGYFIWWGFPLKASLINMADAWIGWFIAGLVMGAMIKK